MGYVGKVGRCTAAATYTYDRRAITTSGKVDDSLGTGTEGSLVPSKKWLARKWLTKRHLYGVKCSACGVVEEGGGGG
jgi:hypothetical protein